MLTIKGRSARTVDAYYIDLRYFFRYLKASRLGLPMETPELEEIEIEDISQEMILGVTISDAYAFLSYVQTVNGNNAATRARKASSLRGFYRYLFNKTNLLSENPMDSLETPSKKKGLPKYLSLEESKSLLEAVGGKQQARDYCIITFLLNCGMRLSELVGIRLESFRDNNALCLLGKGNKERIVFLNDACVLAKEAYLKERPNPKKAEHKGVFFLSSRGSPLSPRRVEQIVEENLALAGLSGRGYSPHKLRHTAATLMYQHGGVDIRVLKEVLGHVNLGTTEIYTHVANRQVEDAMRRSPLASEIPPQATPKAADQLRQEPEGSSPTKAKDAGKKSK